MTEVVMKDNANYFESLAFGVQLQALKDGQESAEQVMCRPLVIWHRSTLLDLAMTSHCDCFIELCCSGSTKNLGFGDIVHDGQEMLHTRIIISVLLLGLPIFVMPDLFRFHTPSSSLVMRARTQRRKTPEAPPPSLSAFLTNFISLFIYLISSSFPGGNS